MCAHSQYRAKWSADATLGHEQLTTSYDTAATPIEVPMTMFILP